MEASARILCSPNLGRQLCGSVVFLKRQPPRHTCRAPKPSPCHHHVSPPLPFSAPNGGPIRTIPATIPFRGIRASLHRPSISHRISAQLGFFQSLSASRISDSFLSGDRFISSDSNDEFIESNLPLECINGGDVTVVGDKGPIVTVVLLGWLGAKPKHLRRYAELYNSRGINAVIFVVSVKEVLSLDLGKRLEDRIAAFSRKIEAWLSESEKDGRERFLLFHTFSNTGWLAYGSILENLHGREDLFDKIKGCVVDSGGDPDINPKVWAAGFVTALLKKRSSAVYPSNDAGEEVESDINFSKARHKETPFVEAMLLILLEKLFAFLLNLPDINRRLKKIISTLSNNQPNCPQLYLYSTADKVIPSESVQSFIQDQKKKGGKVWSFNFGTSPHVDHYRTFPETYSSQLHNFLKESLSMATTKT